MSELSRCPSCDRWVSIPHGLDASSTVRCPLCHEQYALRRALDTAPPLLEAVPPAAPPSSITMPATDSEDSESLAAAASGAERNAEQGPVAANAEPPLMNIRHPETGVLDLPVTAGGSPREMEVCLSAESMHDTALPDLAPVATLSRRRSSVLARLAGIVGGGILGLAIGYLILLWIGGPEKDFLNISHELPQWMLPVEFRRDEPSDFDAFQRPPARAGPAPSWGAWRRQPTWRTVEPEPEARPEPSQFSLPRTRPETAGRWRLSLGADPPAGSTHGRRRHDTSTAHAATSTAAGERRPTSPIPAPVDSPATALND